MFLTKRSLPHKENNEKPKMFVGNFMNGEFSMLMTLENIIYRMKRIM